MAYWRFHGANRGRMAKPKAEKRAQDIRIRNQGMLVRVKHRSIGFKKGWGVESYQ